MASIDHDSVKILLYKNYYENNNGESGGVFYITKGYEMTLYNETFMANNGGTGRIFYSLASNFNILLSNSLISWKEYDF